MTAKHDEEKKFWREELDRYVDWYEGRMVEFYGIPAPEAAAKITRHSDVRMNALETWVNADRWRYCWRLMLEPTYFAGEIVLEVGAGPLGLAQCFLGAKILAVEPLEAFYREVGYPLAKQRIAYWGCSVEQMPFMDNVFDAVISVNSIDHVDDFEAAIRQIERVVRPGGEIRIETHYHEATTTEPVVLNDERVLAAFTKFKMRKLTSVPSTYFYPPGTHPETDRFCVWSNRDHIYPARGVLK